MKTKETNTLAATAAVAQQGADNAPEAAKATTKATSKKGAPKAARTGKEAVPTRAKITKTAKAAVSKGRKPEARDGSKKSAVIELLRRKDGATAGEIAKLTNWQAHSIRGFISGTVAKKMKLAVESVRNEQGERVYKVK